jgi:uncharacterized protein
MRIRLALIALLATLAVPASASAASPNAVISQVYGGGGNSGATLQRDFIELYNRGAGGVDLTGWSVQYASSSGTTWQVTPLGPRTLAPGARLLIDEAAGAGGTDPGPTPDVIGSIPMSATSGKVALVSSATALACGSDCHADADVVDYVGYGGANDFEGTAPAPGLSNTTAALRNATCADTDDNAADFHAGDPAPLAGCTPPPPPTAAAIHDIQGAAHTSPLAGERVETSGIVTALRSNGFYLQDPSPDADDATSEGIFVFTSASPTVAVGDALTVVGSVQEFRPGGSSTGNLTTTEIGGPDITVDSSGNALPAPTVIGAAGRFPPGTTIEDDATGNVETSGTFDPAQDGIDFYESLEGMLVEVDDAVATGPTRDFGSNREISVLPDGGDGSSLRTPRGGIILRPHDGNPERVILNDLIAGGPLLPPVNVSDSFPGATVGVIDYSFGNFKLEVETLPDRVDGGLARETTEAAGPGELSLATFNVENLDPTDPQAKFDELADLIVDNLRSPDLISVEEVQDDNGATNDGVVDASATWQQLIAAVSAAGGPDYEYRDIAPVNNSDGGEPGGNIRVGFMFRTDRGLQFVDRAGGDSTSAVSVEPGPQLSFSPGRIDPADPAFTSSRKPLAGEFTYDGQTLFAVANHWNSKGGDDPLFGRFQPPTRSSEVQREQQAQIVHDFVADLLAEDPSARVAVLGDLNDFDFSDALATVEGSPAILTDLIGGLPAGERYSYVFDGNSQALDHVLTTDALTADVTSFDAVHVNSEFADQASDHDPLVAQVCADATAPELTVTASPSGLWPPNHKYVTVTTTADASDAIDPGPSVSFVSATSNEPDDAPGGSDGSTRNDVVVVGDNTFKLRAERDENGSGRVYTIAYRATDACGNSSEASATVTVPVGRG